MYRARAQACPCLTRWLWVRTGFWGSWPCSADEYYPGTFASPSPTLQKYTPVLNKHPLTAHWFFRREKLKFRVGWGLIQGPSSSGSRILQLFQSPVLTPSSPCSVSPAISESRPNAVISPLCAPPSSGLSPLSRVDLLQQLPTCSKQQRPDGMH